MKWTSEYQTLEDARANIHKWGRRAYVTCIVTTVLTYYFAPFQIPTNGNVTDRLAFALKWQIPSIGTLIFGIFAVANKRFHSRALDPVNGKDQEALTIMQSYNQNTLEQLVISVGSQLALVTYLDGRQLQLIPALVILFVVGRLTFWLGYQQPSLGHTNRAFGFALTSVPSVVSWLYCLARLVVDSF